MRAELFRALGALLDPPGAEHARLGEVLGLPGAPDAAEHTTLFLLNLYPYASVHLGAEGMLGGEARDRVAGFWRALGLTPPAEPDHLGALLGLLASLGERAEGGASVVDMDEPRDTPSPAERALLAQARTTLLSEHLLPWVPLYLSRVRELGDPFYAAWAALLAEALAEEPPCAEPDAGRDTLPDAEAGAGLPVALRDLPPLPDPRSGGDGAAAGFLAALLASARSGMILTRADLARAARDLAAGSRAGERAYILKALLAQDAPGALRWLAGEARRQAGLHAASGAPTRITTFWRERALTASALLDDLASAEAAWGPGGAPTTSRTTPLPRAERTQETTHA